jgi:hypothetical protein
MRGNASGSTLRLSLGCLLSTTLGIQLCPGPHGRMTFSAGEAKLSAWLHENAAVTWVVCPAPVGGGGAPD